MTNTILTIVPRELALDLKANKKVKDYNALPQLNLNVLETIRAFSGKRIGYTNLPMACLSQPKDSYGKPQLQADFADYLPVNNKESVLFILEVPDELIISINYGQLLSVSQSMSEYSDDPDMLDILKDELMDSLSLGVNPDDDNSICFIPFLDYDQCKFFAAFDSEFKPDKSLDIPGIAKYDLRELTTFIN